MKEFFITVVGGLAVLMLASWFGLGGKSNRVVIVQNGKSNKKWKWLIVFSIILMVVGFYQFSSNYPKGGFQNPMSGFGFCLLFFGFILLCIGKFMVWLNRS